MAFLGWTNQESINIYVSHIRESLFDDASRQAMDGRFPPEAINLLFEKLVSRFRPAAVAMYVFIHISSQTPKEL